MNLLHAGVDTSTIALWLGHAGTNATQVYLHADLALKEAALARTAPPDAGVSATGRLTTCSPSSKACNHAHRYAGPIATLTPPGLRQHPPPPASPA